MSNSFVDLGRMGSNQKLGLGSPSRMNLGMSVGSPGAGGGGKFGTNQLLGSMLMGGGLGSLLGYLFEGTTDYSPIMSEQKARQMSANAGVKAFGQINRGVGQAQRQAGSGYAARGLGNSGAAVRDIANLGVQGAGLKAETQAQLDQQLMQLLMAIDQMQMDQAFRESAEKREVYGSIGDLLSTAGLFLI